MKNKSTEEILRAEFLPLFRNNIPDNVDDIPLYELGVDSLGFFEKIVHLEDEFGIFISIEKLDNNVTLRSLIASVTT
jgi:acyl carrier protein